MYAVYHGPKGLKAIAEGIHDAATRLADSIRHTGVSVSTAFFDTIFVSGVDVPTVLQRAKDRCINLRTYNDGIVVALDECTVEQDLFDLAEVFGAKLVDVAPSVIPVDLTRTTTYLTHETFSSYHSETEMLRYLHKLAKRDLALDTAMIPLGSCTMKLNATTEMIPITWPGFNAIHPHAPSEQTLGYKRLFETLEAWLADITGFDAVSLQPNAGSQGEYVRDCWLSSAITSLVEINGMCV